MENQLVLYGISNTKLQLLAGWHGCPARPTTRLRVSGLGTSTPGWFKNLSNHYTNTLLYLKHWEFSIYWMVVSIFILLSIIERDGLPYNIRYHKFLGPRFNLSLFNIWESWPMRSWRNSLWKVQCRKKCSLSSLAMLQLQNGWRQPKLCRNLYSLRELSSRRHLVNPNPTGLFLT